MKVAIIGATGFVGSKILAEALARDHSVTAIARRPETLIAAPRLTAVKANILDTEAMASLLAGHDAVISAFSPKPDTGPAGTRSIVDAVRRAGVQRLLVVGGAGSLELAPGRRLIDEPGFPAEWKGGAGATAAFLDLLRAEASDLDWAFFSPAATMAPGERTGRFRLGGDSLLADAKGESRISLEDYALAMIDELERPAHHRQRFTIAY